MNQTKVHLPILALTMLSYTRYCVFIGVNMAKDLTTSAHDRQNILNNSYALRHAEKHLALGGVEFDGERVFTRINW